MLDKQSTYKTLDTDRVGDSIASLAKQVLEMVAAAGSFKASSAGRTFDKIAINGMGGSNLGARIIKSALSDRLGLPLLVEPGYEVPKYVDGRTVYILSSYSGTTEEPLSTYSEAKKRGAMIIGMTADAGGKNDLRDLMKKDGLPGIIFKPANNPSGQPRLGTGYSIAGLLLIFNRLGFCRIGEREIEKCAAHIEKRNKQLNPDMPLAKNPAKKLADDLKERIPLFIAGHMHEGGLHTVRNQLNESSKNFSLYLTIPEMNHYAFEGFAYPAPEFRRITAVFFDSKLYHPRIALRQELTKRIVAENGVPCRIVALKGGTRLEQAFELLQFGSWLSYYLGMLNNADPVEIGWVDWFKKELKKAK